jgi:hypothetical protein
MPFYQPEVKQGNFMIKKDLCDKTTDIYPAGEVMGIQEYTTMFCFANGQQIKLMLLFDFFMLLNNIDQTTKCFIH